jgi:hypothetical protein
VSAGSFGGKKVDWDYTHPVVPPVHPPLPPVHKKKHPIVVPVHKKHPVVSIHKKHPIVSDKKVEDKRKICARYLIRLHLMSVYFRPCAGLFSLLTAPQPLFFLLFLLFLYYQQVIKKVEEEDPCACDKKCIVIERDSHKGKKYASYHDDAEVSWIREINVYSMSEISNVQAWETPISTSLNLKIFCLPFLFFFRIQIIVCIVKESHCPVAETFFYGGKDIWAVKKDKCKSWY